MKKRSIGRIAIAVALELVGAVVLAIIMTLFMDGAMCSRQQQASTEKLAVVADMLTEMEETEDSLTAAFDRLNVSKAETVALMARSMDAFEMTDAYMEHLRGIIDVSNLLIIDKSGNVVCSATHDPRDYTVNRFNMLKDAFHGSEGATSEPFSIEGEEGLRYYGAKISSDYMVVVVRDTAVLDAKIAYGASLKSTLSGVHVGQDGIVMAISPLDYTFLYHPDDARTGTSAVAAGMDAELLADGVSAYMTVDGTRYYCTTALQDGMYIVCAVPESEIISSRNLTIGVVEAVYLVAVTIMILYAAFVCREKEAPRGKKEFRAFLAGKLLVIGGIGVVCVFGLTFFVESLLSLSRQSVTNSHRMAETQQALADTAEEADYLQEQYNESYLEKAELFAEIVNNTDNAMLTQDYLAGVATALQADSVWYFDADGQAIASSDPLWSFVLSEVEGDQSHAFRKILDGSVLTIVQEPMLGDNGNYCQYVGVAIQDENHKTIGMAQIGITADALQEALARTGLADVLSGIKTGNNGFVFAVNASTGKFDYYPDATLIGQEAASYGFTAAQLLPGFNDFITINGVNYYCQSAEYDGEILYVAVPMATVNNMSAPIAGVACGFALVWMLLLMAYLCLAVRGPQDGAVEQAEFADSDVDLKSSHEMITVDRGDGRKIRTRSVLFRFSSKGVAWEEKSAAQKIGTILSVVLLVAAVAFLIMILMADSIFPEDSIMHYILKGTWQKGFNIFAVTQCLIVCVSVIVISVVVRKILMLFADKLGAKGETVCRLVCSFIKFGVLIGLIYVCLAQLGVDTSVLLTSAGILSLVVGLGANSLIKDILAGLMIVFEGTFRVGDIVTISGFRGTVIEIGIRTVKVKEGAGNIKIFSNSSIGDVLNMTKDFSVVACDMSIEYGEDLQYVEEILAKEFPRIRKELTAIKDGPFYKGVSELGDNSVNIKIVAKCNEADRIQLDRDLRRALKLVFDEYGINIPFPQVVLNQPETNFHKSSARMKREAEAFREKQADASKGVYGDDESQQG